MKNNKGFSLVELIVVIAIMAILAAIAIPTFATFINKANVSSDVSFINDIEYSAKLAHTGTGDIVKNVTVNVNDNGSVETVVYDVYSNDGTVKKATVSITAAGVITVTNEAGYNIKKEDVEAVTNNIDLSYKFKSTKAAGAYKLDTDGKALVPGA